MARYYLKNVDNPDDSLDLERVDQRTVHMGDITCAWIELQPGWRWSVDIRPLVGGNWCQSRHVGFHLSGRTHVLLEEGDEFEIGPHDAYVIPPGHDAWVVGDEPSVTFDWSGARGWIPALESQGQRVLATVLITDIVDSTAVASRVGDLHWRTVLSNHNERSREILSRYRGREVSTTGDGFVATFDGAARAVLCALELCRASAADDLSIRAALTTGEVELVGDDIRGITVHEVARMLGHADGGQVVVSSLTRELAGTSTFEYADLGERELKGVEGPRRLFAATISG